MPAPRNLLNVRTHLERTLTFCEALSHANTKYAANLGPAFLEEANAIRFLTRAILARHAAKQTRKDITL